MKQPEISTENAELPSGVGAAAVLSAGLGSFALAVLAIIGDHSPSFKKLMTFYQPTGPLSGVTTTAVLLWIVSWIGLDILWKRQETKGWAITTGLVLMTLGFLLMFPPLGDLF